MIFLQRVTAAKRILDRATNILGCACHRESGHGNIQRTFVEKMATPKKKYGLCIRLLASK